MQHLSVEQIWDLSQCKLKIIIFATLNIASQSDVKFTFLLLLNKINSTDNGRQYTSM